MASPFALPVASTKAAPGSGTNRGAAQLVPPRPRNTQSPWVEVPWKPLAITSRKPSPSTSAVQTSVPELAGIATDAPAVRLPNPSLRSGRNDTPTPLLRVNASTSTSPSLSTSPSNSISSVWPGGADPGTYTGGPSNKRGPDWAASAANATNGTTKAVRVGIGDGSLRGGRGGARGRPCAATRDRVPRENAAMVQVRTRAPGSWLCIPRVRSGGSGADRAAATRALPRSMGTRTPTAGCRDRAGSRTVERVVAWRLRGWRPCQ